MSYFFPVSMAKLSGAGNTFVLVDARPGSQWVTEEPRIKISRAEFAKRICNPVTGVSTDGVLFIEKGSDGFDFDWDFYNSDGSTAEMCGNAARCAARFCYERLSDKTQFKFKTGAGLVTATLQDNGEVSVVMPQAQWIKKDIEILSMDGAKEKFSLVNTGVPHLVQKIKNLDQVSELLDMAREMRSHPTLAPSGANVTFYSEDKSGEIKAVTYERGVEDYTLACGTGAVAAAMVYADVTGLHDVKVAMPGGSMRVEFSKDDPHPLMTGPALLISEFKINLEVLK
jgi:diaminopimelate epimerase